MFFFLWERNEQYPEISDEQRHVSEALKQQIRSSLPPSFTEDDYWTAVVLACTAYLAGPFAERLMKLTDYPLPFVERICRAIEQSGLWEPDGVFCAEWFNEDASFDFEALWTFTRGMQGALTTNVN